MRDDVPTNRATRPGPAPASASSKLSGQRLGPGNCEHCRRHPDQQLWIHFSKTTQGLEDSPGASPTQPPTHPRQDSAREHHGEQYYVTGHPHNEVHGLSRALPRTRRDPNGSRFDRNRIVCGQLVGFCSGLWPLAAGGGGRQTERLQFPMACQNRIH